MPNPFPGMNPYLEKPSWWKPLHFRLISILDRLIRAQIKPPFYCSVEERVYLTLKESAIPDVVVIDRENAPRNPQNSAVTTLAPDVPLTIVAENEEVTENYLEIRLADEPGVVVTAIEVLSPKNKKRESMGRDVYIAKQKRCINSESNFLEIDLLRRGAYSLAVPYQGVVRVRPQPWHYGICLHRGGEGAIFEMWLSSLRERLPIVSVPLTEDMPDLVLNMNEVISILYEEGSYDTILDYSQEPAPPLSPEDALWLDELLRGQGLR